MLDMQNVKELAITEGDVRTIHDANDNLLWGRLAYDTKYVGDTTQQTYSGKNLLRNNDGNTETISGVTFTKNPDGTITANGTATEGINYYINGSSTRWGIPEGTYTLSTGGSDGTSTTYFVFIDGSSDVYWNSAGSRLTQTVPSGGLDISPRIVVRQGQTLNNVVFKPMLEQGSTPTSYEPYTGGIPAPNPDYPQPIQVVTGEQTVTVSDGVNSEDYTISLGSIELCKIGTHQDYIYHSGADWYVHKAIGYTDLATQTWGGASSQLKPTTTITDIKYVSSNQEVGVGLAEKYILRKASGMSTAVGYIAIDTSAVRVNTGDASITPTGLFYYALATPTDTQITDATLISQLDAIHEWMTRYGYNSVVTGNLPIIINQTNL